MKKKKNIAIVAHDNRKKDIMEWYYIAGIFDDISDNF